MRGDGTPLFRVGPARCYSWDGECGVAEVADLGDGTLQGVVTASKNGQPLIALAE